MAKEHENHKDEDESIVEALSSLGWVEDKEEGDYTQGANIIVLIPQAA